jgi:hypothetical protein
VQGPFAKTFAFYEDIQIERPASTGKSCNTFGGLPPIRDLRWMKSEYECDIRAAKWSAVNVRNDKWDEQVAPEGRDCSHEEASAAPHRGSPTQTGQGGDDDWRRPWRCLEPLLHSQPGTVKWSTGAVSGPHRRRSRSGLLTCLRHVWPWRQAFTRSGSASNCRSLGTK